ncbi:MAG TPA: amidase family protein [Bryobacteraceae bacterium]|nr:amidase family protein [Bryobacteraceae bacterium]
MNVTRRQLAAIAAAPFVSRIPRLRGAGNFDPDFGSASDAARAIRGGVISSRELTAHVFTRIRQYNARVNAFVTLAEAQAAVRARAADEALAQGQPWGPLHGVPILMKDDKQTAGIRSTCGSKMYAHNVPTQNAPAVERLLDSGAIIVGKTNLPEWASDFQSYNDVAGTTNNPWNVERTSGGSTGGGAAALACGMGFLELGSDIGGSIRTPSHFCGVFGHKPTIGVISAEGFVAPPAANPAPDRLSVNGPLARSPRDLLLAMRIAGGPVGAAAVAYSWNLPPARGAQLRDYRIGYVVDDPFCAVTPAVRRQLENAITAIGKAGARLEEGWPRGMRLEEWYGAYFTMLGAAVLPNDPATHRAWGEAVGVQYAVRRFWADYFRNHDAFLMPVDFVTAFPHDHSPDMMTRKIATPAGPRPYLDMLKWIFHATLTGNPATVCPIGRTAEGLPCGIQILGPYLEDATPIDLAGRIATITGGFVPPPLAA